MVWPLWKTIWWGFFTKLNILLSYNPAIMLLGISPKELKTYPHKNVHTDIYSSFIQNSPNSETNKMSFIKLMEKQTVLHPYNEILFSTNVASTQGKAWRKPKCILLSERSQSKKVVYCMTP